MSTTTKNEQLSIESIPLKVFTEKAYLDYSMYVILDRALPHIGDGLKPVQRRIVYAMAELGLSAGAKYKKSARTVGDVLGKFHPHGESACYEAMVLMAQSFSYRYPLIDGQGNWGSPDDPKSFAAMRYTEAKLSRYADVLLQELTLGTIDWAHNFDGTLDEPELLPARLPNVLLNPTTGIAVGMATDIPPHNLREVANACIHLLAHPKATLDDILQFIPAPDYPTEAEIITPAADIATIYREGNGMIRLRSVYQHEKDMIIITALPHQISGAKVLEQIAEQMQAKKLPMIADLRDESDHENPTRLVIELRSNRVDIEKLMAHLFATTDLEHSYRINLNMIGINGKPQVKNLLTILNEWLEFRTTTVTRRTEYRLEKIKQRLHILDGLLIAFLNIDKVIAIIREADEPKSALIKTFKLTDTQAESILEIKLRHLAKLEEIKIRTEQAELQSEQNYLEKILSSPSKLKKLISDEISEDAKKFGDERRSPLVARTLAVAMDASEVLPTEPVTIVLSKMGWVRAAKGHEIDAANLSYKAGDTLLTTALGRSNESVVFLDSSGRSYSLTAHTLPSARGQGEPLSSRVNPPVGAAFVGMALGDENQRYLVASGAGYGFIVKLAELYCKNRSGKSVIKPAKNTKVLAPRLITNIESDYVAALTNQGYMLVFPVAELPELARGKGNKIINIPSKNIVDGSEYLLELLILGKKNSLVIHAGKRKLTLDFAALSEYQAERGRRGHKLPRNYQKVDSIEIL